MKPISIFILFFLVVMVAGASIGYGFAHTADTGNPLGVLLGGVIGVSILIIAYKKRPREGRAQELLDLMMGDMEDPVQRNISIRMMFAAIAHAITLSIVYFEEEPDIVGVNLADGIAGDEVRSLVIIGLFCLSLIWVMYECWRFYNLDEFWRRISAAPLALGGAVCFVAVIFWHIAELYLGAPEMDLHAIYLIYWMTIVGYMLRCLRAER